LRKTCCAFANSSGGFLLYGIADQNAQVQDRLVGVEVGDELPKNFGNYPAHCNPTISWDFKNPPLQLENGKLIHVIHIPRSWNAPHGFGSREEGWQFWKRTNKGNEGMSYEEIRLLFLGYYEKRLKLQLLVSELENVLGIAANASGAPDEMFIIQTFDLAIINSVLADTYTILAEKRELMTLFMSLRNTCQFANNIIGIHMGIASTQQKIQNLSDHRKTLNSAYKDIVELCNKAIPILQDLTVV
jgi:hypothetical protein